MDTAVSPFQNIDQLLERVRRAKSDTCLFCSARGAHLMSLNLSKDLGSLGVAYEGPARVLLCLLHMDAYMGSFNVALYKHQRLQ